MDLPNKEVMCHKTGFTQSCRYLVIEGKCNRWMQIQGSDPNTGESVNQSRCVDDWIPMLLIENSQQQRQTGAAVESFRNEMVNKPPIIIKSLNKAQNSQYLDHDEQDPTIPKLG